MRTGCRGSVRSWSKTRSGSCSSANAYSTLWESLAINQRKFLKGLASEVAIVKPFAGEFVRRSGLGSPSNAQRAVDGLLDRDVIDRENGSYLITNHFFRLWVQRVQLP